MARMVRAYLDDPEGVAGAADSLQEAARRGETEVFLADVFGLETDLAGSQSLPGPASGETTDAPSADDQGESA